MYVDKVSADLREAKSVEDLNDILERAETILGNRVEAAMLIDDCLDWNGDEFANEMRDGTLIFWSNYTRKFEILEE
jgi:hypothetical protein